mmetsp:Transcript_15139/g.44229  ORF Transcript_15139/g.44229 Transcript_15139/m.44229 type:complete len:289 (-) Transcript_15139:845-1711(-)
MDLAGGISLQNDIIWTCGEHDRQLAGRVDVPEEQRSECVASLLAAKEEIRNGCHVVAPGRQHRPRRLQQDDRRLQRGHLLDERVGIVVKRQRPASPILTAGGSSGHHDNHVCRLSSLDGLVHHAAHAGRDRDGDAQLRGALLDAAQRRHRPLRAAVAGAAPREVVAHELTRLAVVRRRVSSLPDDSQPVDFGPAQRQNPIVLQKRHCVHRNLPGDRRVAATGLVGVQVCLALVGPSAALVPVEAEPVDGAQHAVNGRVEGLLADAVGLALHKEKILLAEEVARRHLQV